MEICCSRGVGFQWFCNNLVGLYQLVLSAKVRWLHNWDMGSACLGPVYLQEGKQGSSSGPILGYWTCE